jgi:hypothetical protein
VEKASKVKNMQSTDGLYVKYSLHLSDTNKN